MAPVDVCEVPLGGEAAAPLAPPLAPSGYRPPPAALVELRGCAPRVPRFRAPGWPEDEAVAEARARIATAEQDPLQAPEIAAALLAEAGARLEAMGVAHARHETADGHPGLRILPDPETPLGAVAAFLDAELDGFRLVYSPAKLFADATRGAVWGYRREVVAAHDLVFEGRLDPITRHEVEHAALNVAEEQGRLHRWLGYMQSRDGNPLSEVDAEQGGYLTYCSLQEIPAYAAQVRALGQRLHEAPEAGRDLAELEAMARWGRALSGRIADVCARAVEHLDGSPENAVFKLRRLSPQGRDPGATPEILWVSIQRPELRVDVPLLGPGARDALERMERAHAGSPEAWAEARAPLLAAARRKLCGLVEAAQASRARFSETEARATAAQARPDPLEIRVAAKAALSVV